MIDIANYLLNQGENDSAVARKMGVSRQTIARWKEDSDKIPTGKLKRLAELNGYKLKIVRLERSYEG